jgi:hypothetical protein
MAFGCSDSAGPEAVFSCTKDAECLEGQICSDGQCSVGSPLDRDHDTIPDNIDNCPDAVNTNQADTDSDGIGNACDIPNDDDKDGIPNIKDNCITVANADQADDDDDDIGNACDDCPANQCAWKIADEPELQLLFDPRKQLQDKNFGSDNLSIFDYSGKGHNGKMSADMAKTPQTHPSALFFDGVNDFVDFQNILEDAKIAESDSIMSIWIKTPKRDRYSYPMITHYSGGFGIVVEKFSGRPILPSLFTPTNYIRNDIAFDVSDDNWHLLTVVNRKQASNMMFLDSKLIYEESLESKTSKKTYWVTKPLYMGFSQGDVSYFSGYIGAGYILVYNGQNGAAKSLSKNFDAIIKKEYKKTKDYYQNTAVTTNTPKSYYFSSIKGKDENDCLSIGTPCKTLLRLHSLWNNVGPGDNILFERGSVYAPLEMNDKEALVQLHSLIHPPFDKGGTADGRITIGAYGTGNAPIISTEKLNPAAYISALAITGGSFFTIRDIEFRGHVNLYAYTNKGVHDIIFTNIVMDSLHSGGRFKTFGRVMNDCVTAESCETAPLHDIEIGKSTIKNVHQISSDPEKWIWLDAVAIVITGSQGNIWIHDNDLSLPGGDGCIDMTGGDNITIEYNKCIGLEGENGGLGYKIQPGTHTINNLLIRGNLILIKGGGQIQAPLIVLQSSNSNIYNNTLVGWPSTTIKRAGYSANLGDICTYKTLNTFTNNTIANNIFIGVAVIDFANGCSLTFRDGSSTVLTTNPLETNKFSNNIYYHLPGYGSDIVFNKASFSGTGYNWDAVNEKENYLGEDFTQTSNWIKVDDFTNTWLSNKNVAGDKLIDPLFNNPTYQNASKYGDFRLQTKSPAKGAGMPISDYKKDLEGKSIAPGVAPNIGCY